MDLSYTPEQQAFRAEVRAWMEANVPKQPLEHFDATREGFEAHRQWEAIATRMAEPLAAARQRGDIRREVDVGMVIATLFTTISGMILMAKDVPSDDYLRQLVDLLIAGAEARRV